jgi:hypothetical protein
MLSTDDGITACLLSFLSVSDNAVYQRPYSQVFGRNGYRSVGRCLSEKLQEVLYNILVARSTERLDFRLGNDKYEHAPSPSLNYGIHVSITPCLRIKRALADATHEPPSLMLSLPSNVWVLLTSEYEML